MFGGSSAVVLNSKFAKRVYNDLDSDFVEFFRTIRNVEARRQLLRRLRDTPMSREEYESLAESYVSNGLSFAHIEDPAERAAAVFYRSSFSFGGKMRDGGFSVSAQDRLRVKELGGYRSRLGGLAALADGMRDVLLENLPFEDLIKNYGKRKGVVLYCDPPYYGFERYYSRKFRREDHQRLAELLIEVPAAAVVSYYAFEGMDDLYPDRLWEKVVFDSHKNRRNNSSAAAEETLLIKRNGIHLG